MATDFEAIERFTNWPHFFRERKKISESIHHMWCCLWGYLIEECKDVAPAGRRAVCYGWVSHITLPFFPRPLLFSVPQRKKTSVFRNHLFLAITIHLSTPLLPPIGHSWQIVAKLRLQDRKNYRPWHWAQFFMGVLPIPRAVVGLLWPTTMRTLLILLFFK